MQVLEPDLSPSRAPRCSWALTLLLASVLELKLVLKPEKAPAEATVSVQAPESDLSSAMRSMLASMLEPESVSEPEQA